MAFSGQTNETTAGQLDLFEQRPLLRFRVLADQARRDPSARAPIRSRTDPVKVEKTDPRTPEGLRRRVAIAKEVCDAGGAISEFGRRIGLGTHAASKWLRDGCPDLHEEFLEQQHPIILTRAERMARLRAVQAGQAIELSNHRIAAAMGLSGNRLRKWLAQWAPFGVEEALELEELGEDEAWDANLEEAA